MCTGRAIYIYILWASNIYIFGSSFYCPPNCQIPEVPSVSGSLQEQLFLQSTKLNTSTYAGLRVKCPWIVHLIWTLPGDRRPYLHTTQTTQREWHHTNGFALTTKIKENFVGFCAAEIIFLIIFFSDDIMSMVENEKT